MILHQIVDNVEPMIRGIFLVKSLVALLPHMLFQHDRILEGLFTVQAFQAKNTDKCHYKYNTNRQNLSTGLRIFKQVESLNQLYILKNPNFVSKFCSSTQIIFIHLSTDSNYKFIILLSVITKQILPCNIKTWSVNLHVIMPFACSLLTCITFLEVNQVTHL